jgi:hypothetical protein
LGPFAIINDIIISTHVVSQLGQKPLQGEVCDRSRDFHNLAFAGVQQVTMHRLLVVVVPRNLEEGAESKVAEIDKVNREEIRNKSWTRSDSGVRCAAE